MRVITGTARGCRLEAPEGTNTRPTADRVKEGLFSAIQFDIPGRRVLDAFAGSGQMGIEALSRGATHCVFVDRNKQATEIIRRNLVATKFTDQAQIATADTLQYLARTGETFDIIFLDPPYGDDLLIPALQSAARIVAAGGLIVCEHEDKQTLPEEVGLLHLHRTYRYGRVYVTVYR